MFRKLLGAFSRAVAGWPQGLKPSRKKEGFIAALKSVRENWVVPPGFESWVPLYPALKRGAKVARPCGTGICWDLFHRIP